MNGSGIHSTADDLIPYIRAIDPVTTAMVEMPIGKYGLDAPEVLDAIARVASAPEYDAVRTYNTSGKLRRTLGSVETLEALFQRSSNEGVTYNVEHLERYIPQINAFAIDLSSVFGATVAVHAFVSAGGVPSTPLHYDYSDAFTFQLRGRKWWRCFAYHDKPIYGPAGHQINTDAVGAVTVDRVLVEGDCLFVPMGGLHLVQAVPDSDSVHLAVSVKPLGYQRFMAEAFGPHLDQPAWIGLDFDGHAQRLADLIRRHADAAANGDVATRARNAVWHHIYESYVRAPYPVGVSAGRPAEVRSLRRSLGRPVAISFGEASIAIDFIDPEVSGPIGRFDFRPSRIELPAEARPFAEMIRDGHIDAGRLYDEFDPETVMQLGDLVVRIGLFQ